MVPKNDSDLQKKAGEEDFQLERAKLAASKEVVAQMKKLFAEMMLTNRRYADPTRVLEAIVDDSGNKISIYEQKDIGEFFQLFLERLQDGLGENKAQMRKLMNSDFVKEMEKAQGTHKLDGNLIDLDSPEKLEKGNADQLAENFGENKNIDDMFEFQQQ